MPVNRNQIYKRFIREGRWREVRQYRLVKMDELKASGMSKEDAGEESWRLLDEAYPPLVVEKLPPPPPAEKPPKPAPATQSSGFKGDKPPTIIAPPIPWDDLPVAAEFNAEVAWVHQQYIRIIEETKRGCVIHWDRATEPPPSTGACSLARWAADNRTAFYKDMLPKAMAKQSLSDEDSDLIREEDIRIEEMEKVLKKLRESKGD